MVAAMGSITAADVYAQSLGKLFFEEKGKITGQKPLGVNGYYYVNKDQSCQVCYKKVSQCNWKMYRMRTSEIFSIRP